MNHFKYYTLTLIVGGSLLFIPRHSAVAYTYQRLSQAVVGVNSEQVISLFDGKFTGGASVAAGNVRGDEREEIIIAAGPDGGPQVEIYSNAGRRVGSFTAYPKSMRAGMNVATGDLDGDGLAEIVVSPQNGYRPEVRIFSNEKLVRSFNGFEKSYEGGARVAVIPARGEKLGQIAVASGEAREQEIRIYQWPNLDLIDIITPGGNEFGNGHAIAGGWSARYQKNILVVGASSGQSPLVRVYALDDQELLSSWMAYDRKFRGGLEIGYLDDTVITGPRGFGGPDVRQFTVNGNGQTMFNAFENTFWGGVHVALASQQGKTVPIVTPARKTEVEASGKKIVIDLSEQTLQMFQKGKLVSTRKVSTGKWSTPTPTGKFKTWNKVPVAYSSPYKLYMEYWMAITADGKYGLHSLPYWALKNGGKLYEGAAHIGTPVSHGCVRQTVKEAKSLYDWAPIGTPVEIKA